MLPRSSLLLLSAFCIHSAAALPHILLVLADDLGWANVGWHRKGAASTPEVQTPILDGLVAEGIELNRFYVYKMCSPTRSALQTGRLPMHVNTENANPTIYNAKSFSGTGAGIPRNMSTMAKKLKSAGYYTVMAGKWDAGMATPTHTPWGRGYDSALCYFHHANSYWTQGTGDTGCGTHTDLYDTHGPAWGLNSSQHQNERNDSSYEEAIFHRRLSAELEAHDPKVPLFMFYAAHLVHLPYECPQDRLDRFCKAGGGPFDNETSKQDNSRMTYAAMTNYLDDAVGQLVTQFKSKGMWDNTLMWFMSDNGGPIYVAGNNYPLRGGKYSDFEGGVRSSAFAAGGAIPLSKRGKISQAIGCVADVYTTLCSIAGVDPSDPHGEKAGLPPVDGMDLSKVFLDADHPLDLSPRSVVPLSPLTDVTLAAFAEWEEAIGSPNPPKKTPECYITGQCDVDDTHMKFKDGLNQGECCDLCNATEGCLVGVWKKHVDQNGVGNCSLYASSAKEFVTKGGSCLFPSAKNPPPRPIIYQQAGIVDGDLKLVTGVDVSMAIFTGPFYPNKTTPLWTNTDNVPGFACSSPTKLGCLFNVSADPTEHHDLWAERPADAQRLLTLLQNVSATYFNPDRGDYDQRACKQIQKNRGFFGPWLEMDDEL